MSVAAHDGAALLASPVRRLIVDTLHTRGELSAAQLGQVLDLHVTTVRFHLDQLVAAGLLESRFVKHAGAGRPRKIYAVAPGSLGSTDDHESLKLLTGLLAETFNGQEDGRPITPADAGARWARINIPEDSTEPASTPGQWLAKVGRMIDVLQDWGYTPELTTSHGGRTARVELANCPFLELARTNPAVVCGIHRGLIAGAMTQFGEPDTEVSLQPFVQPRLCLAHVTTRTPFTTGGQVPAPTPLHDPVISTKDAS